jgi:hypothetical protein
MTAHPTRQFAPAALNAGFAPHCRRSDARGLTRPAVAPTISAAMMTISEIAHPIVGFWRST